MADSEQSTRPGALGRGLVQGDGDLAAGARVGDYRVIERISAGGFGTVYRAEQVVLGRPVALKVLHGELLASPQALARFEREARAVNLIRHPNVIDVFDFEVLPDGRPFFAMELLVGEDLETHLGRRGRLGEAAALALLEPLCAALGAAHAKGVVHRDVKASNVFIAGAGEQERVVLLDFGIAHLHEPGGADLTSSRQVIGTPACMAPEQLLGRPVDARADIYALAVLLHHMLAGAPPWPEATPERLRELHLGERRPRLSEHAPVSPDCDSLIARGMAVDPAARIPDVATFLAEARQALALRRGHGAVRQVEAPAILVEVRVADDGEPSEAQLEAADTLAAAARRYLSARGWNVAIEGAEDTLYLRMTGGDLAGAISDATSAWDALQPELDGAEGVTVCLCVGFGPVTLEGDRARGGPLLRFAEWAPSAPAAGVFVSERASAAETFTRRRLR